MSDDEKQVEEIEAKSDPKPKKKSSRVTASAHWVQINISGFANRYPDMAKSAESVFQDHHLDDEHLSAVLNRDLPPELNHFIRWLLKIPYAERTEWLNK